MTTFSLNLINTMCNWISLMIYIFRLIINTTEKGDIALLQCPRRNPVMYWIILL